MRDEFVGVGGMAQRGNNAAAAMSMRAAPKIPTLTCEEFV